MSNSFNISVAPEIAAVSALVTANGVIVADIHDTDLPDVHGDIATVDALVDAVGVIVTDIHDTDLPAVEADIATVDTVVDAIQIKTDAMPQNVRSKWLAAYLTTPQDTWQIVVDVTGSGILYGINETHTGGQSAEIRLTLDSVLWIAFVNTDGMQFLMPKFTNISGNDLAMAANPPVELFRFEFWQNMKVEIRETPGHAASVNCKVHYSLDQF